MALNWYVLAERERAQQFMSTNVPTTQTITNTNADDFCDKTCVDKLYTTIATLSGETETIIAESNGNPDVTEYFVSFGSGTGSSTTYQNVSGMQTYVDTSQYKNTKQVVFEASITIPTQNQSASLQVFNTTAQHPVWNSIVSMQGGSETQFLISQPVQLDPGNNLYQVQLQTQLGSQATINQARFHITTY